jgi:sec-independent protein translocase protein TatB
MFNVGGGEIIVVLLLALVVLGPDKLPEAARKAGKFLHEFRRMTSGFQEEVRSAMDLGSLSATPKDNALDRTEPGPRLAPKTPSAPSDQTPNMPETFSADVVPTNSPESSVEPEQQGSGSDA